MFLNLKLTNILPPIAIGLLLVTDLQAQVVPDGSTPTTVTIEGDRNIIRDGRLEGTNLFHSFSDFSLPNGGEAPESARCE